MKRQRIRHGEKLQRALACGVASSPSVVGKVLATIATEEQPFGPDVPPEEA